MSGADPTDGGAPPRPSADPGHIFHEQLRGVVEDLLCLEINTVVKDNMTTCRMPSPLHALLDIAQEYDRAIGDRDGALNGAKDRGEACALTVNPKGPEDVGEVGTFQVLRGRAKRALAADPSDHKRQILLSRIKDNCDILKMLLGKISLDHPAIHQGDWTRARIIQDGRRIELSPTERATLRKIWEVGTEEIVAQTVISLNGDVVQRVASALLCHPQGASLIAIHRGATDVSIAQWHHLVLLVKDVFSGMAAFFTKRP
jgi:hypothetical protein